MSSGRLTLPLEAKIDGNGQKYYIAKLKGPISINCKDGICLLVFTSDSGNEELQIADLITKRD